MRNTLLAKQKKHKCITADVFMIYINLALVLIMVLYSLLLFTYTATFVCVLSTSAPVLEQGLHCTLLTLVTTEGERLGLNLCPRSLFQLE